MALWRDPLDELIADLERAVPAAAGSAFDVLPPVEDVQLLVAAILWGNDEERARVERDPRVQAVIAYHEQLAARRAGTTDDVLPRQDFEERHDGRELKGGAGATQDRE